MRLRRPLPAVQGDTLHIVGVGDNRIGKDPRNAVSRPQAGASRMAVIMPVRAGAAIMRLPPSSPLRLPSAAVPIGGIRPKQRMNFLRSQNRVRRPWRRCEGGRRLVAPTSDLVRLIRTPVGFQFRVRTTRFRSNRVSTGFRNRRSNSFTRWSMAILLSTTTSPAMTSCKRSVSGRIAIRDLGMVSSSRRCRGLAVESNSRHGPGA